MAFKIFQSELRGQPLPEYGASDLTIKGVLAAPFSFSGTASRLDYWIMLAVTLSLYILLGVILYKTLGHDGVADHPPAALAILVPLAVGPIWYQLATTVRRLRDRGWPNGAIVAINILLPALSFVPMVNGLAMLASLWFFIECAFLSGRD
jgi:uncharacterized membrane protein YhaH (DUF805 family)